MLYAPTYLGIVGRWTILFNVLGTGAFIISIVGASIELGKFRKSEALSYWAISLVFLIPAGILLALAQFHSLSSVLETIVKVAALLLLALGRPFFFVGVPHLFWKEKQVSQTTEEIPKEEIIARDLARREARFTIIASIVIASVSLTAAVVNSFG